MKNDGLSECTIRNYDKYLAHIARHADLGKPEQVKQFIANKESSNSYKHNLCLAYDKYCNYYQIQWYKPFYKRVAKTIRIPTEEQLQSLIASTGKIMSVKLTISKETGLRPVELCNLKTRDVDLERKTIYPTTAKYGAPRILKISNSLTAMLTKHINENNLNPNDKLFKGDSDYYGQHYRLVRNKLAKKLNKLSLQTIKLYDFRHYFATMLYAKTKDILYVKQQLGHRKIETTLIYTQLLSLNDDEWTCKATTNTKQATELIENGFEYVTTTPDELMLFRKRK